MQDDKTLGDQAARAEYNRNQNTTTRRPSNVAITYGEQVWLFMERVKPGMQRKQPICGMVLSDSRTGLKVRV